MLRKLLASAASLLLLFASSAPILAESQPHTVLPPVSEQTWKYLDERAPDSWSITAYSLAGRPVEESLQTAVTGELELGLRDGFGSITQFERAILSLVKLDQDPGSFQKHNLVALLAGDGYLYHEGLDGASTALLVYQAAGHYDIHVDESMRNSSASVIDFIVSSQQRQGGFAVSAGRKPDIGVTARAVSALAAYSDTPYVQAAIEKAILWLSAQQNSDGTFSQQDKPDCETTANVLIAMRTCGIAADDSRFSKNGRSITAALDSFQAPDGGYRPSPDAPSSVAATELAVIAHYADFYGLSPYLHPAAYPGYSPVEEVETPLSSGYSIWKFLWKFALVFGVVYLLLLLTVQIGRYAERKKLPGSLAAEQQKQLRAQAQSDTASFELHIPMQAALPDFDTLREQEAEPPHTKKEDDPS